MGMGTNGGDGGGDSVVSSSSSSGSGSGLGGGGGTNHGLVEAGKASGDCCCCKRLKTRGSAKKPAYFVALLLLLASSLDVGVRSRGKQRSGCEMLTWRFRTSQEGKEVSPNYYWQLIMMQNCFLQNFSQRNKIAAGWVLMNMKRDENAYMWYHRAMHTACMLAVYVPRLSCDHMIDGRTMTNAGCDSKWGWQGPGQLCTNPVKKDEKCKLATSPNIFATLV
ncbi:uncharacterized protein EDB93DRAFT_1100794 [Suillus bovinus]|uniref:uncharacterized protein n=1 Tax=Suillus bovinus TaxID=48563 RepID=UPI001B873B9F|nr:uncharacterized protein EDB93DRAFT_1100794 [Suillus bovinus]KAG2157994.1 hypothetical protein EDB93DRAFT_1100794 [Suillus bovinus]